MKKLILFVLVFTALISTLHAEVKGPALIKQQHGELDDLKGQLGTLKRYHKNDKIGIHIAVGATGAGMIARITNILNSEKLTNKLATVLVFGGTASSLLSDKYLSFDFHQLGKLIEEVNKLQSSLLTKLAVKDRYEHNVRWRPSYKAYLAGCKDPESNFRSDLYIKVYTDGLQESMQTLLLNPNSISQSVATKGISSSLDYLLNDDAFINAMNDCQSDSKHHAFVAKLLAVDSVGKFVGVSAAVTIYKGGGLVFKGVFAGLEWISPVFAARAKYAAMALGIANYLKWVYGEYSGQKEIDSRATKADPKVDAEARRIKSELLEDAKDEIANINEMLADRDLSADDRKELLELKAKWQDIIKTYQ